MSSTTAARRSTSPTADCEHGGRHQRAVAPAGTGARSSSCRHRSDNASDRERRNPYVAAQSIAEFWSVATRPAAQNGLGFGVASAASAAAEIERTFEVLLSDEAIVYQHWKRLIVERRVTGRRVFDARLVAVMLAHGVARLLTFNGADFAGLGVMVIDPHAV